MGEVVSIVYKSQKSTATPDGYTRAPLPEARLIAGYGIDGDAKGGSQKRQLNVMAADTLKSLAADGFHTGPGQLGEQIIFSGVDIDGLSPGARLRIGTHACIEVVEPRTGCGKLERYHNKLKEEAAGRLGMMARVVEDGTIRVGDPVEVL